ncbi:hypothetical protein [Croceicoccus mobilis]|uniref:Uncharacterized protein n=1 Tax=Croceicoccus mobilis TaxID=1703339 RepID=A0A917DR36_9SPHN|nr:hypothetical protein [Croceicoccus mobilis]GGD61823.1 hypothetical protein GCM10010990_09110 [Croceicoccus mobilis]
MTKKTKNPDGGSKGTMQRVKKGVNLSGERKKAYSTKITSDIKPPSRPKK